jgi:hypothetical protein
MKKFKINMNMKDKYKPAWTAADVVLMGCAESEAAYAIADAHNAALTAEEQKNIALHYRIDHMEQQLAAEREELAIVSRSPTGEWTKDRVYACIVSEGYEGLAKAINSALAAEREKQSRSVFKLEQTAGTEIQQLREQLEAERQDQVETLADLQDAMAQAEQLREQRDEAIRLLEYKEKQLADERKASSLLSIQLMDYHGKLAAAQAAIRKLNSQLEEHGYSGLALDDTTALDSAIAEASQKEWHKGWAAAVEAGENNKARLISEAHSEGRRKQAAYEVEHHQKPLVGALTKARKDLGCVSIDAIGRDIDAALAKAGES